MFGFRFLLVLKPTSRPSLLAIALLLLYTGSQLLEKRKKMAA